MSSYASSGSSSSHSHSPPSYKSSPESHRPPSLKRHKSSSRKSDEVAASPQKSPSRARHTELSLEDKKLLAEQNVRRGKVSPEFLKDLAEKGMPDGYDDENGGGRFKVIAGSEAASIYETFLREDSGDSGMHDQMKGAHGQRPVVFAFTVQDAGRKVVDYYMTWRGKVKKAHRLKGENRKPDILDEEFKKMSKAIDKEYKRLSHFGDSSSVKSPKSSPLRPQAPETTAPAITPLQTSAPLVPSPQEELLPPPKLFVDVLDRRPLSNGSVTSLPLLSMVRGVPLGNRVGLRVTNPDAGSLLSPASERKSGFFVDALRNETIQEDSAAEAAQAATIPEEHAPPVDGVLPEEDRRKERRARRARRRAEQERSRNQDDDEEILIVLVDDKNNKKLSSKSWHSLPKEVSHRTLARTPSARQSPWNGPPARPRIDTHYRDSSGSGYSSFDPEDGYSSSDYDSEFDHPWKNAPVVPIRTALVNLGYLPSPQQDHWQSYPTPQLSALHRPHSSAYTTPYSSPHHSPLNSPYNIPYASPYTSPYVASAPNLSYAPHSPYLSPHNQMHGQQSPYSRPPSRAPSWPTATATAAALYSSPYVPPQPNF